MRIPGPSGMRWIAGILLAALATCQQPLWSQNDWSIADFDVAIELQPDGTLDVQETITAEFPRPKHGIFREIPIHYAVGAHQYSLRFRLVEVTDQAGAPWPKKVRHKSNLVEIRIGDPDVTVGGKQVYRIRYTVQRAIIWEGEHAVLRWNATGTEWRVPIGSAKVTVRLPRPLAADDLVCDAWTGRYGARGRDFRYTQLDERTLRFETDGLGPQEGISIDVAMPQEFLPRPPWGTRLGWWLSDNFVYGVFLACLATCLGAWYLLGRDLPGRETIVVAYHPPDGFSPAESGTLIDERVDLRDISATLIDLAVRGYLRIEEVDSAEVVKTDFRFVKLRDGTDLKPFEQTLVNKLFAGQASVLLSDLKEKFYPVLPTIRSQLYQALTQAQYFDGNPDRIRTRFAVAGVLILALVLGLAAAFQFGLVGRVFPIPLIVAAALSLLVVGIVSRFMPRKTRTGRIAWEQIRGLEEFIRRAEVDDLQAAEKRGVFERLLPYAIMFGLTERWARAFADMYREPPNWYQPAAPGNFTTASLVHSMNRGVHSMNEVFPSQPRSSGGGGSGWSSGGFSGGSSGGGFGGGGGGAW